MGFKVVLKQRDFLIPQVWKVLVDAGSKVLHERQYVKATVIGEGNGREDNQPRKEDVRAMNVLELGVLYRLFHIGFAEVTISHYFRAQDKIKGAGYYRLICIYNF